jgi:hypothetical protein
MRVIGTRATVEEIIMARSIAATIIRAVVFCGICATTTLRVVGSVLA